MSDSRGVRHGIESPVLSVEALVVRTPREWILTSGDRREGVRIDDDILHALVRASGGALPGPDDPARAALEAVGVALPTADGGGEPEDETGPGPGRVPPPGAQPARTRHGKSGSLRLDDTLAPSHGFVARVSAGCLLVEGREGARITLDVSDLLLVEAVRGPMTVTAVLQAVATETGLSAEVDGDLGLRLRRLVEAGRLDVRHEQVDAVEPVEPEQAVVASPATGWKAFVRRHRFPGRGPLIKAYRRLRDVVRPRRGPRGSDGGAPPAPAAPLTAAGAAAHDRGTQVAAVPAPTPPAAAVRPDSEDVCVGSEEAAARALSARCDGRPFHATVVLGGSDQTVESLWDDLQFLIDHGIPARFSPDANTDDARDEVRCGVDAFVAFEQVGILRHVLRVVQWDHGIPATRFLQRLVEVCRDDPDRYPLINWVFRYHGTYPLVPLGWRSFFNEVRRFLVDDLDVPLSTALDSVLDLQAFLLPEFGRSLPAAIPLAHDYVAYHADKTAGLWVTGRVEPTTTSLGAYGPSTVTVGAAPQDRAGEDWELESPLGRGLAGG